MQIHRIEKDNGGGGGGGGGERRQRRPLASIASRPK